MQLGNNAKFSEVFLLKMTEESVNHLPASILGLFYFCDPASTFLFSFSAVRSTNR